MFLDVVVAAEILLFNFVKERLRKPFLKHALVHLLRTPFNTKKAKSSFSDLDLKGVIGDDQT